MSILVAVRLGEELVARMDARGSRSEVIRLAVEAFLSGEVKAEPIQTAVREREPERVSAGRPVHDEHLPDLSMWDVRSSQNGPLGASRTRRSAAGDTRAWRFCRSIAPLAGRQDTSLRSEVEQMVPYSKADVCWCQPFGRSQHPDCPTHGTGTLPGMAEDVDRQEQAAAELSGEELTQAMLEPLADISKKTGELERRSPLFFGTGENPGLFNQ